MSGTFLGFSTTGTTAVVRATLYILENVLCGHHGDCRGSICHLDATDNILTGCPAVTGYAAASTDAAAAAHQLCL